MEATEEARQLLTHQLGLDKPIYIQYLDYIKNIAHGDFGESFVWRRPAISIIAERIPATVELAFGGFVFAVIIGVGAGILASVRANSWTERLTMGFALFGQTTPFFWIGLMLIMIFSVELRWLPSSGREGIDSLILPAITAGIGSTAAIARLTRSRMKEIFSKEYIKLARLKGLSETVVVFKHTLRNAAIPIITLIGMELGILLGGAVITETVFAWPGIGRLAVQAVLRRDYAVVSGITIFISLVFVGINLVIDLTYGLIDPRVKLGKRSI
jgi:peptide/nickel transport system permease protein